MSRNRKLLILVLALIVVAVSFYYITSYAMTPSNPYTELSVPAGSSVLYQTSQNRWGISYYPANSSAIPPFPALIVVLDKKGNYNDFKAVPEGSYNWDGLQLEVSALYSDHIELLARPSA